jgi:hypothetical protein
MFASTGTSSTSVLGTLVNTPGRTPIPPSSPDDDSSQSFADLLHQHGGDSDGTIATGSTPAPVTVKAAAPATSAMPVSVATAASRTIATQNVAIAVTTANVSATTSAATALHLGAVFVAAGSIRARAATKAATAEMTAPDELTANATTTKASETTATANAAAPAPAVSDLATMMIQAMLVASQLHGTAAKVTTPTPVTKDATPTTATTPPTAPPNVATILAQASPTISQSGTIPASTTPNVATTSTATAALATAALYANSKTLVKPGTESPLSGSGKTATTVTGKEKKSTAASPEGSFLQSDATTKDAGAVSNLTTMAVTTVGNGSGNQQVAMPSHAAKSALNGPVAGATASVGTASVEKKSDMNTDSNIPTLVSSAIANVATRAPAEVNILLSSNSDFEDALKQVVHIAQLRDSSAVLSPTRIAIELQTPPGAIVNVYVSKQDDGYRAQLSTSDPAALSWVQDKITTLRQGNEPGVEVKWLPAQLESNSLSATATSSNGSNLDWNRNGQNQNYQQPDDRSQSQRQEPSSTEDLVEAEAETFSTSLTTAGGAA